jgi:TonB-linked SusC/RagA family outer membrane protein
MAAGWSVSNEKFIEDIKWLNNLKLRVGYGVIGNQNIPNYSYGSALQTGNTGLGPAFFPSNIPNRDVTWEKQRQTNIGLDLGVFNNQLELSVDYFNKASSDFLLPLPLPDYLGVTGNGSIRSPVVNAGEISNKGFDISLRANKINLGPVEWNSSLIFSAYKNIVNDLKGLELINTVQFGDFAVSKVSAGLPVGSFIGYRSKGLFTDPTQFTNAPKQFGKNFVPGFAGVYLGDVRYADVTGDGKVDDDDVVVIGNPNPDFTYGFTNNFSYKGFDLGIFVQGSQGGQILNMLKRNTGGLDKLYNNQLKEVADYWTPTKSNSTIARPRPGNDNQNLVISDRFLEDASYLRIQNLTLGYHLPKSLLRNLKVLSNLKVYASVQNLKTFTNYSGYDPEIGAFNQNPSLLNVDNGRYPMPRTYTFGVNLEF